MSEAAALRGLHILVVDDNEDAREILQHALEFSGALVTLAENGRHALEHLKTIVPDLIVCDISMPELDGLKFIATVRAMDGVVAVVPAIAFSGFGTRDYAQRALAAGYQAFLIKPFDLDQFSAAVEAVLEQRSADRTRSPEPPER